MAQSSFSLEGGLNFSKVKMTNSAIFDPQFRAGYFLGIRHNIPMNEKISFNYTFQYTQDGYANNIMPEINSPENLEEVEFRYHYFRLIPHIEFHLNSKIGLFAGPNLGAGFKEELRANKGKWIDVGEDKFIENVDFALRLGARYHIKRFTISANYNHGFTKFRNINETDENGVDLGLVNERNRSIQIGLGYAFIAG